MYSSSIGGHDIITKFHQLLKVWALPKIKAGKDVCAPRFCMHRRMANTLGACESMANHALGAWLVKSCPRHFFHMLVACCLFLGPNSLIFHPFRFLFSNNLPRNLKTKFLPLVNPPRLLNLHSWSS